MSEEHAIFSLCYRYKVLEIDGGIADLDPQNLLFVGAEIMLPNDVGEFHRHRGEHGYILAARLPGMCIYPAITVKTGPQLESFDVLQWDDEVYAEVQKSGKRPDELELVVSEDLVQTIRGTHRPDLSSSAQLTTWQGMTVTVSELLKEGNWCVRERRRRA